MTAATDGARKPERPSAFRVLDNHYQSFSKMPESDSYFIWARILVDKFFSERLAGQRSRLMIDRELLDEEYLHLGGYKGFIKAVNDGPSQMQGGFHDQAIALEKIWRRSPAQRPVAWPVLPDNAPLYLPHLAIICLAWTIDSEGLEPNAFYARLALIVPDHNLEMNQHLGSWEPLWSGLEKWSSRLNGKRGIFRVECLGHMTHIGKPRSQVILTPTRVKRLPEFFVTTGIAASHKNIDEPKLTTAILSNEGRSRAALGNMLYNEILGDSVIGRATVNRLFELLQYPDFRFIDDTIPRE